MTYTSKWEEIEIPDYIGEDTLNSIRAGANTIGTTISVTLNVLVTVLEAIQVFLIAIADPLAAAIDLILSEIRELLQGILDLDVSVAYVYPTLEKPVSVQECFKLLGDSCTDKYDPQRPITSDTVDVEFASISFVGVAESLDLISPIINSFNRVINTQEFLDYAEYLKRAFEKGDAPAFIPGQAKAPNWQSGAIIEYAPWLKDIVLVLVAIVDALQPKVQYQAMVAKLIQLLERRIAYIDNLVATIDAAIEAYQEIVNTPFRIYAAAGEGTAQELAASYNNGATSFESAIVDAGIFARVNIGAVVTLVATGPTASTTLLNLFGVDV